MLLVNLLAALNFANVFLNEKRLENKKTLKTQKNVFTSMGEGAVRRGNEAAKLTTGDRKRNKWQK